MALKLPTGDPDAALGSGRPDLAFGAALEKTLGRWSLYANLNVTVPIGDRFSGPHLTVHPIFSGLLGVEYRLTPTLALVGHVSANSPPFRNTRMDFFDDWTDWCVLGLSWAPTPRWRPLTRTGSAHHTRTDSIRPMALLSSARAMSRGSPCTLSRSSMSDAGAPRI